MAFETVRGARGRPEMRCTCDDCGRVEVVPAIHGKSGRDGKGQAVFKLQKMKWSYIGKRLRCVECEANRRVAKMTDKKAKPGPDSDAPREPTRAEKRQIMDLLDDVYDTDLERYRQGDTDETVADVLNVKPGWVAQLREEFFGPAGGNEDMVKLAADLTGYLKSATEKRSDLQRILDGVDKDIAQGKTFLERLRKIENAVGPRVLAKAGRRA